MIGVIRFAALECRHASPHEELVVDHEIGTAAELPDDVRRRGALHEAGSVVIHCVDVEGLAVDVREADRAVGVGARPVDGAPDVHVGVGAVPRIAFVGHEAGKEDGVDGSSAVNSPSR